MDYDQTQPLTNRTRSIRPASGEAVAKQIYRCPCGTDVEVDPKDGGKCEKCERLVPATVTRMSMTMSLSDATKGFAYADATEQTGPDELIGQTLGHFEIIESIGQGGMGQVYRALDTSLQRYVAVKVIRGETLGELNKIDTQGQQRLMHEAVAQARVNHPNIVTIYYVGREGETPFLAMELIDGYDASDLIKQGEVPYETLCSIAIKITHALDVASQTGIIHSDIKPQNLLILKDGNVKLSDFGMARMKDEQHKIVGGTPNYLAPELLSGNEPTIQSDMYALGVTLFELSFGRLPVNLTGSSLQEWSNVLTNATVEFPVPWPDHLPEKWREVLLKLLDKDPDKRYQDYESLGKDLQKITPTHRRKALLMARSIAWVVDLITITLLTFLPMLLVSAFVELGNEVNYLGVLPGLCVYLLIVYWWRQSLGRELVHVKIVNQYSLNPTRKKMLLREVIRMQLLIMASVGEFADAIVPWGEVVIVGISVLISFADWIYTATIGHGTSIHDKIFRTRAVVGSDTH